MTYPHCVRAKNHFVYMFNKESTTNLRLHSHLPISVKKDACRFVRIPKYDFFELDGPQKHWYLRFIQKESSVHARMATKNQNEPIILRVRFMRIIKDAATLVTCAKMTEDIS